MSGEPTIAGLGEAGIIQRLRAVFPQPAKGIGIGDDLAVIPIPGTANDLLLGSDATLQGRHFTNDTPLDQVGHKLLGRVLSDVAAMGGTPCWALLDLVLPADLSCEALDLLLNGIRELAAKHNVTIVGGDTTQGDTIQAHAFIAGTVPTGSALRRSGASADDLLYVTGSLGGSRNGKHLTFEPRLAEGQRLRGMATAAIDISDGLATDAQHIANESNVHIIIEQTRIPRANAPDGNQVSLAAALSDGEDFELLFTVPAEAGPELEATWPGPATITRIGRATHDAPGVSLQAPDGSLQPLSQSGFQHFSAEDSLTGDNE